MQMEVDNCRPIVQAAHFHTGHIEQATLGKATAQRIERCPGSVVFTEMETMYDASLSISAGRFVCERLPRLVSPN